MGVHSSVGVSQGVPSGGLNGKGWCWQTVGHTEIGVTGALRQRCYANAGRASLELKGRGDAGGGFGSSAVHRRDRREVKGCVGLR